MSSKLQYWLCKKKSVNALSMQGKTCLSSPPPMLDQIELNRFQGSERKGVVVALMKQGGMGSVGVDRG
jgi:hypothetical protein